MTTVIKIGGTEVQRVKASLSIRDALEQRSTANFALYDSTGIGAYARGQSVQVINGEDIPMAPWLPGWRKRTRPITIDHTKIDAALTWFPIMLRISGTCGANAADFTRIFDELGAEKLKLAITKSDGLTQLYVEIEKWDEVGEEAILWVSKSGWSISDSADTVIYLYYDSAHADNTTYVGVVGSIPGKAVWDANFVMVQHMANDPDTSHIKDSTSNANNGTKKGADEPAEAAGLIGKAQDFDDVDDFVATAADDSLDLTVSDFTMEMVLWEDENTATAWEGILLGADYNNGVLFTHQRVLSNDGALFFFTYTVTPTTRQWNHVTITHILASKLFTAYLNGASNGSQAYGGALPASSKTIYLGERQSTGGSFYDGLLDEIRLSNTARSAAWLKATDYTCWDQLITIPADDDRLLFSGFIDTPRRKRVSATSNKLYWFISCIDNHYLADKRIAAESYTGQTAGFIVNDLFTKYLEPEGVAVGSIEAGPTIAEMVINYARLSDALSALASKSNKIWQIDKYYKLWFIERGTTAAPFAIDVGNRGVVREADILSELAEASPLYRNRQYVRAGKSTTTPQTENFTGDGATVAFALGYPLHNEPTITVGGAPQTVGIKGLEVGFDWYWNKGDAIVTAAVAPALAAAVVVQYIGEFDILVQADNIAGQLATQAVEGGTGIVEAMDDEPSINDSDDALDDAKTKLDYFGVTGRQFTFPIRAWGLEPGQMVTATHTPYGLSADELLVESVNISEVTPGELRYTIQAVEGPELGDWTGFFKSLADMKQEIMDRITLGQDQVLIILVSEAEGLELSEAHVYTIYACYLVDSALVDASYVC